MDTETTNSTIVKDVHDWEIAMLIHTEWENRLNRYWSLAAKAQAITFIFLFFPLIYSVWDVNIDEYPIPPVIFPILGILFSLFIYFISRAEMNRINSIKDRFRDYIDAQSQFFSGSWGTVNRFHRHIPTFLFGLHATLGILVIIIVLYFTT